MASDHILHVLFFPFMAQGHILPTIDMAKLFSSRGVRATVLTTPANAALIKLSIDRANGVSGHRNPIQLSHIPFPSGTGLPEGCENMSSVPMHLTRNFFDALPALRRPFRRALKDLKPDCVVSGAFLHWTYHVAAELGIPRLVFDGSGFFSQCAVHSLGRHEPLEGAEPFVVLDLPHRIRMLKSQVPEFRMAGSFISRAINQSRQAEAQSYGVIVNSFYELEPAYADYYRDVVGRKAWHIGPVSLCNEDMADKSVRGNSATIDFDACSRWLDGKRPCSVLYVCFGSLSGFDMYQLRELALGLEASGRPFIWVMRGGGEAAFEGFEKRVEGRGLIIRGWAPQTLILSHGAVGGFLTHCGWNSCLEGIAAGLPLITWPLFADQMYNERLIVDVLKIGISVRGTDSLEERWLVEAATIEKATDRLMGEGEEAEDRRRRVRELGEAARKAVGEDGSSYVDMSNLIKELEEMKKERSLGSGPD